ncbi:unnamed protein product [Tuber aestivum]|uniref:Major facilitator superfamily (MFS) profile domain-containing protein n=1 Tax=Tuber aestivum TaxID=59557 RepID=A0A292Q4V4_9PEZI|nr:unnamed protein product [Tuber aestivum]
MPAILVAYTTALTAGTALFGWNLAELNAPQNAIQEDLGLGAAQFGLASSILAIGGLLGSAAATPSMNAFGRKKILIGTAIAFGVAGSLKAIAGSATLLTLGRFIGGIASGSAAVIVPIYINELAPPASKGALPNFFSGALTQISINLGILSSQVLGILLVTLENKGQWRFILLTGGIIGFLQAASLLFLPESPTSLVAAGKIGEARRMLVVIRGTSDVDEELASYQSEPREQQPEGTAETENIAGQDPLIVAEAGQSPGSPDTEPARETTPLLGGSRTTEAENSPIGLMEFVRKREYRSGFVIVAGVMLAQQLTGINAVVFYGVSILNDLLPNTAKFLNAAISAVNLLVTFGASFWFDRVSHRTLLLGSIFSMGISAAILSICIACDLAIPSAVSTLVFVTSFSMGLGPLPWMVASLRIAQKGIGAAQSIALIANWMGTFLVGFVVPVIADAAGMYIVFAVFAVLSFLCFAWGVYFL